MLFRSLNNTKQIGLSLLLYAEEYNNQLPDICLSELNAVVGNWAWDVSRYATTNILRFGAVKEQFYCPSYNNMNDGDRAWNFNGNANNFRVIGYIPVIVLGQFGKIAEVGQFSAYYKYLFPFSLAATLTVQSLQPALVQAFSRGERQIGRAHV